MTTTPPSDARSTIAQVNLQEVIDASTSAKAAVIYGQQQYQTPKEWARILAELLPRAYPHNAFDPQCAGGNLFTHISASHYYGFEIDKRFAPEAPEGQSWSAGPRMDSIIVDCNKGWEMLDTLFPDVQFECQVANPPFALPWPGGDSTYVTWLQILKRACPSGYGYFISNRKTIERFGINRHPWVYLYQIFPPGFFPKTGIEVGVVHWMNHVFTPPVLAQDQGAAPPTIHYLPVSAGMNAISPPGALRVGCGNGQPDIGLVLKWAEPIRSWLVTAHQHADYKDLTALYETGRAWESLMDIVEEERKNIPPWNVWLADDGTLRIYLSLRFQMQRKLKPEEIQRLQSVAKCHPLALTVDVETRTLLKELIECGAYTIEPKAVEAIRKALDEVACVSAPIMPVTDFERVAYADECDQLPVRPDYNATAVFPGLDAERVPAFTPGQRYKLATGGYRFTQAFTRKKPHYENSADAGESAEGGMTLVEHQCELNGTDRYIEVVDNAGTPHRFLEHPDTCDCKYGAVLHPEAALWHVFERPEVPTVADLQAELCEANRLRLLQMQTAA